jgi:EAL domain-containing protein (putative c-di-GMP-specific phosphodiesterase class I)
VAENWIDRAKTACDRIRGDFSRHIAYYNNDFYEKAKYQERLINDIDDAIKNKDLKVYYQPKYSIQGDTPVLRSAEALIRWQHPELGMISPGDFIPLFESNGLIQKLDRYVWKEAAFQVGKWKKENGVSVPVSVNVSRMDIYYPKLRDEFIELLEINGLDKNELMLEITESAYADNAEQLVTVIEKLRIDGFLIEMDDFGSGYSSLNMLTTIPIDALKMDMKFIRNMQKDEKSMKLVELVIDIAKFLGIPVIAEGVETEEQLMLLKERGCDIVQGYYFSKPVPPEEFTKFFA